MKTPFGLGIKCRGAALSKLLSSLKCLQAPIQTPQQKQAMKPPPRSLLLLAPSTHHCRAGTGQDPACNSNSTDWHFLIQRCHCDGKKRAFFPLPRTELALQGGEPTHQQTCSALQSRWLSGGGSATCSHGC